MISGQDQGLGNGHMWLHFHPFHSRNNIHIKASWWNYLSMLEASQKFTDQVEGSLKTEDLEATTKLVNMHFQFLRVQTAQNWPHHQDPLHSQVVGP